MVLREPTVEAHQVQKAVTALLKHVQTQQRKQSDLFDEDELLYLVSAPLSDPSTQT